MANTVSVVQAAEVALVAWLKSQISDVTFTTEWPDPAIAFSVAGQISLLRAGSVQETPIRPPDILKKVDDAPPAVTSNFYWRTHSCEQSLQLDVWCTSQPRRDDILNRLGDALTASKKLTLAAFLAAQSPPIWSNQSPVEQALTLQLPAPWDHLLGAYQFDSPETDDSAASSKRREFRATYRGTAFFDRTVIRNSPRLLNPTAPTTASPGTKP